MNTANLFASLGLFALVASGCTATPSHAQHAPKLLPISQRIQQYVDQKEIAGAVTVVAKPDRIVHLDAVGYSDLASKTPMRPDNIFWIASMTKPITATAVMMLAEQGLLSIDDPAEKYLPEFAKLKAPDGSPANITLRHLLTHTAGLSENTAEETKAAKTLSDLIPSFTARPLQFAPGSKWQYSQTAINSLGRIVEIVAGQPFEIFLENRLFRPLAMTDTTFYLSPAQKPRLAKSYKLTNGQLEEAAVFILDDHDVTYRTRYPAANGGLFSTAADYTRFAQMILNEGTLDGKRFLKPESVKFMTTAATADLKTGFTDGNAWALGWCVVRQPQGPSAALSPNSFGHGGAYGTQAWIDPVKKTAYILMVQRANFPNADASDLRRDFQNIAAPLAN